MPSAVARAVPGQAQKRARLPAFPVPLGGTLGTPAARHQAGLGWRYRARELRQALSQDLLNALRIGLGLEPHDAILARAPQGRLALPPWLSHPLAPEGEPVVKGEGAEHDAPAAPLGDPCVAGLDDAIFQHPSFAPPSDHTQEARVSDPVLPHA